MCILTTAHVLSNAVRIKSNQQTTFELGLVDSILLPFTFDAILKVESIVGGNTSNGLLIFFTVILWRIYILRTLMETFDVLLFMYQVI